MSTLDSVSTTKITLENSSGNCKFCNKLCHNQNSLRNHERLCKLNPDRKLSTAWHSPEAKQKAKQSRELTGVWNKGLTKETDSRLAEASKKISAKMKGNTTGLASTPEQERERRAKLSSYAKEHNFGGRVQGSGRGKKGWYKGFFCDSTYELVYVIYNLDNNVPFSRCKRTYTYQYDGKYHQYYPDFELPDGTIVETKGYHNAVVDAKVASVTDRAVKLLYESDLQYAFDWVKAHYTYNKLEDLYER